MLSLPEIAVGQRVARSGTPKLETIAAIDQPSVKIKWDDGSTSYYKADSRRCISQLVGADDQIRAASALPRQHASRVGR